MTCNDRVQCGVLIVHFSDTERFKGTRVRFSLTLLAELGLAAEKNFSITH